MLSEAGVRGRRWQNVCYHRRVNAKALCVSRLRATSGAATCLGATCSRVSTRSARAAHRLSVEVDTDGRVSHAGVVAARSAAAALGLSKNYISPLPMKSVWTVWT
jgi:hypothetical protein